MGEHPTAPRLPCPSCLWELGGVMSSQRKGMCVWTGERHDSGFKLVSENPADETSKDWRLTVSQGFVSVLRPACSLVSQFQEEPGLPLCRKVCYAIGGIPYQMTGNALGFFFQIFLLDVVQLEPFHASLILFLGRAWDAVTDPAIGFLVSKSPRRKFGKLVPWIACSTPFGVLFYCMMWSILPDTTSVSLTFLWYLFTYSFFQTCMTCYHVPYSSLTMFLGGTQRDRDLATAYRMGMEVFSTLLGAGIQGQIVGSYHTHMMNSCYMLNGTLPNTSSSSLSDSLENTRKAYTFASLVLGSIYCLSCLILIFGVREQPDCTGDLCHLLYLCCKSGRGVPSFGAYHVGHSFPLYSILAMAFGEIWEENGCVLRPSGEFALGRGYGTRSPVGIHSSLPASSETGGPEHSVLYPIIIPALVAITQVTHNFLAFIFLMMVAGCSMAVLYLLPWSMLPDAVDDFRLRNPSCLNLEALFYSFYVFFNKFAGGLAVGISTLSLHFAGYHAGDCTHNPSVILTLQLLMAPVPISLLLIAIIIFSIYPINEKRRKQMRMEMEAIGHHVQHGNTE
ncbi:sodium-dependent lysophosphatidylcholine symporter 1-B-like isoform X9 [Apteryx rowi]|uniref:sodium-dependent lysophosphatidylcholine symporter 1-B-like isoform X9 n=1 Tax=Apteryx rowi TaxID=308060 RepID=UPI000E1C4354|nr:sodium-dependent lysophosphatidylcholine symporter 1-B-like isoform X9 [Apteryx rowi]